MTKITRQGLVGIAICLVACGNGRPGDPSLDDTKLALKLLNERFHSGQEVDLSKAEIEVEQIAFVNNGGTHIICGWYGHYPPEPGNSPDAFTWPELFVVSDGKLNLDRVAAAREPTRSCIARLTQPTPFIE